MGEPIKKKKAPASPVSTGDIGMATSTTVSAKKRTRLSAVQLQQKEPKLRRDVPKDARMSNKRF